MQPSVQRELRHTPLQEGPQTSFGPAASAATGSRPEDFGAFAAGGRLNAWVPAGRPPASDLRRPEDLLHLDGVAQELGLAEDSDAAL